MATKLSSLVSSTTGVVNEPKKGKYPIWPEWNEADINAEKWDGGKMGKDKSNKSPILHFFDDPEGKIELPPSLKVHTWKRPLEFITRKSPVVVANETWFDLLSANEHLLESELMRWIISEILAVWRIYNGSLSTSDKPGNPEPVVLSWKPWEHIYALCKAVKGHVPQYNSYGKYVVKLYWMGCWRKITVDDTFPFDEHNNLLLPVTTCEGEMWPMLLSKAIIKLAMLDMKNGNREVGEFTVLHALTGWIPEIIPLQQEYADQVWNLLKETVLEFKLPDDENVEDKNPLTESKVKECMKESKEGKVNDVKPESPPVYKTTDKSGKDKAETKDAGKKKGKEGDKEKEKSKSASHSARPASEAQSIFQQSFVECTPVPTTPQMIVYAGYLPLQLFEKKTTVLSQMTDSAEMLRHYGLSHAYSHPVLVTRTRSCPLIAPPKPPPIPRWKLIRPKKHSMPTDEPQEPVIKKPDQFIEIATPFLNFRLTTIHVPEIMHQQSSSNKISSVSSSLNAVSENDETVQENEEDLKSSLKSVDVTDGSEETKTKHVSPPSESLPDWQAFSQGLFNVFMAIRPSVAASPLAVPPVINPRPQTADHLPTEAEDSSDSCSEDSLSYASQLPSPVGYTSPEEESAEADSHDENLTFGKAISQMREFFRWDSSEMTEAQKKYYELLQMDTPSPSAIPSVLPAFLDAFNAASKNPESQPPAGVCFLIMTRLIAGFSYIFVQENKNNHQHKASSPTKDSPTDDVPTSHTQISEAVEATSQLNLLIKEKEDIQQEKKPVLGETWISFEDFCKCFQTLYVFHKPFSYSNTYQKSEFKSLDEQASYYLLVDSLKPFEILVSFSALLRWGDSGHDNKERDDKGTAKEYSSLRPGSLVAEPYSWKYLAADPPVLQICTSATRAALMTLPSGRHVLRFTASSSLGYHIHLCSTVPFVFGEEEIVMPYLDKESIRFIEQATTIMRALGNVMNNFSDANELPKALKDLELAHCPLGLFGQELIDAHVKAFNSAVLHTFGQMMGSNFTPELKFACKAVTFDVNNSFGEEEEENATENEGNELPTSWQNKEPTETELQAAVIIQAGCRGLHVRKLRDARKPGTEENAAVKISLEKLWATLEPSIEQHAVALLRHMFESNCKSVQLYPCYGDEWTKVSFSDYIVTYSDQPANSWFLVFREVFHFAKDMMGVPKIYTTIPSSVLHVVKNDTLEEIPRVFSKVVPYTYTKDKKGFTFVAEAHTGDAPLPAGKWRLRLIGSSGPLPVLSREPINNSFAVKELRDYYVPNEKQILFRYQVKVMLDHLATVQLQTSQQDVHIKLQILDNEEEVANSTGKGHAVIPAFYFLPNERPSSSYSTRSQPTQNLAIGGKKGTVSPGGSQKGGRSASRAGNAMEPMLITEDDNASLAGVIEEKTTEQQVVHKYIIQAVVLYKSWKLSDSQLTFAQQLKEVEKNEIRLYTEKHEEPVVTPNPEVQHPSEGLKSAGTPKTSRRQKDKTDKTEKEKSGKDKEKEKDKQLPLSRPESQAQSFDISKPYWILRVVSDQSEADTIDIKRDTERIDEIKAMKQAWESAEPGRAIKAVQSRLQFINKYLRKTASETTTEAGGVLSTPVPDEGVASVSPSPEPQTPSTALDGLSQTSSHPAQKRQWEPLDLAPFIRKSRADPQLKDELIAQQQEQKKAQEIQIFRQLRDHILESREQEHQARNLLKMKILQMYEDIQASMDEARHEIFQERDSYRNRLLEAENKIRQEIAAKDVAAQEEQEKKSPTVTSRQKSAKRGKSSGSKK
ncbi:androglobin [Protopterus annectens]|uniref:androglobin n=1 Tax=Protopterus annectens TaxID=7888 RepID=UPI001CFB1C31|nr:androglobin [Protopterus annectens]